MNSVKIKGYILGFIAAATYGLNPLFALPLLADGMDTSSILFFRYMLAIPILAIMMLVRRRRFAVSKGTMGLMAAFGILVGLSSITLFESYRHMQAGIASTILFVYPLMVAVIMAAVYRERITPVTIFCLTAAMTGIALLYKGGDGAASLSLTGTVLVLVSALCYAIYIVGVNKSRLSSVPTLTVTFYVLLWGVAVFAADMLMKGHIVVPADATQWACVGALALLPTAVSFVCTTAAVTYIGSTPTAILGAMEPLTAVVIGITIFHERLTATDVAGLFLILAAVLMVIVSGSISHPLTRIRKMFPRRHRH